MQSAWGGGWLGHFLHHPQSTQLHLGSLYDPALAALGWVAAFALYRRHTEHASSAQWRALLLTGFGTDYFPSGVARAIFAFAHLLDGCEERVFNRIGEAAVDGTLCLARNSAWLDTRIINQPIMASADGLGALGGMVRKLQTGKIYHYLAAAFVWIIVIGILVLAVRVHQ